MTKLVTSWLERTAKDLADKFSGQEIVVSSGVTPSGKYHVGTLREIMTAEAIHRALKLMGVNSKHIHVVDDFDVFRKVPADLDESFSEFLGKPLTMVPAPDGSNQSYADFFVQDLHKLQAKLNLEMKIVRASENYASGQMASLIEASVERMDDIKQILSKVSGHKIDPSWSAVQVLDEGRLKNRKIVGIDKEAGALTYIDSSGAEKSANYRAGEVKLNWRVDWPARWKLLNVKVEPFGRDHATKGGSYETGSAIAKSIFNIEPPVPVPYEFIMKTGQTKKISKSAGDVISAAELVEVLPPEVIWYFMLSRPPKSQLFFGTGKSLAALFDEFSSSLSDPEFRKSLLHKVVTYGVDDLTVSSVPFTLLVDSFQAALKDKDRTIEIIKRTEYKELAEKEEETVKKELNYIENWLSKWAPEDIKFKLAKTPPKNLTNQQVDFLKALAEKVKKAPQKADGLWFHNAIHELREAYGLSPAEAFKVVYQAVINQEKGPKAGWFLSELDREWLIDRFELKS